MTYTPEWPSELTTGDRAYGLFQFQEPTWKAAAEKVQTDPKAELRRKIAARLAGKKH